jgi:hypothetical protein
MGSHPVNLAVRFALELVALGSVGAFGWSRFEGPVRWGAAIALVVAFMVVWGLFNVPDDPSRSGRAPVGVPGWVRLGLEIALFSAATFALARVFPPAWAAVFGGVVVLHYALSWDRIAWLLRQ